MLFSSGFIESNAMSMAARLRMLLYFGVLRRVSERYVENMAICDVMARVKGILRARAEITYF